MDNLQANYKWDQRYMKMAQEVASWSKDPSTKIGAVSVGEKGEILSTGYNGFPRNTSDDPSRYEDRTFKYAHVVHAEANCIYNACRSGISLMGSSMYVYGLPCCHECAKGIIQVGVKRVVMDGDPLNPRWKESVEQTLKMFKEAGVQYDFFDG